MPSADRARRTIWLQDVPRRMRAVLGFSTALGARFSRARLERAFRGFLCRARVRFLNLSIPDPGKNGLHLAQHFVLCWWNDERELAIGGFPVASCDTLAIARRRSRKSRQGLIDKKSRCGVFRGPVHQPHLKTTPQLGLDEHTPATHWL